MVAMMPYERFDAWKACHALVLAVYRATGTFPKNELYGLTSQARRAAFSAAANIAEGSARRGRREFRRYLDFSFSSLSELAYTLRLARDLGILPASEWEGIEELRARASRLTWGLYKSMRHWTDRPTG